jgi:hypothetical protein
LNPCSEGNPENSGKASLIGEYLEFSLLYSCASFFDESFSELQNWGWLYSFFQNSKIKGEKQLTLTHAYALYSFFLKKKIAINQKVYINI